MAKQPARRFAPPRSRFVTILFSMGIGAELVLLAIDDKRGEVRNSRRLAWGLAAAELVELALIDRIGLNGAHVVVQGPQDIADDDLSTALVKLSAHQGPMTVAGWIAAGGSQAHVDRYLLTLERAGTVRAVRETDSKAGAHPTTVHIADRERTQAAIDRFRTAAHGRTSTDGRGSDASVADEAFAALADAVGLTHLYLGGLANRRARARLATLTAPRSDPPPEPGRTVLAIVRFAVRAMGELSRRQGDRGEGSSSMAIPVNEQVSRWGSAFIASENPNIP